MSDLKPKKPKKTQGGPPAAASASASASWAQASAEVGLGRLTVTEAALAAMFDQAKEVEDPIFAVSLNNTSTAAQKHNNIH